MKKSFKLFYIAALVLAASCAKTELAEPEKAGISDGFVDVEFNAVLADPTKATLTPNEDETLFTPGWENGDAIKVYYSANSTDGTVDATWNAGSHSFTATLPEYKGAWDYKACYPAFNENRKIDFGTARTQDGNKFNSLYDIMTGSASATNADAGKDNDGNPIVFNFERQTAILYFHLKSSLNEPIVKAILSVEGGEIANSNVTVNENNEIVFGTGEGDGKKTIELSFPNEAPSATDFTLWFNVKPTAYTSLSLAVETPTKTYSISNTTEGELVVGKLYEVKKEGIAWTDKPGFAYVKVTENLTDWSGYYLLVYEPASGPSLCWTGVDDTNCNVEVTIDGGVIDNVPSGAATLTIAAMEDGYSIKVNGGTNNGKYIGRTKYENGMDIGESPFKNTLAISEGSAVITGVAESGEQNCVMRYNTASNQGRFRYYKGTQQPVQLYKCGVAKTKLDTPTNLTVNSETKTVSWTSVLGAASYSVSIGENDPVNTNATSYAFSGEDEYYTVSVIAIPSDTENYRNSDAAVLEDQKFGNPTLDKPELEKGAVDENSITVTWTNDVRATNGYTLNIYKKNGNEWNVLSDKIKTDVTTGTATFTELTESSTYKIEVFAQAITEGKTYVKSETATSEEITTVAPQHVSDVTEEGNYTIKNLTVYANNSSQNVVGDGTGFILDYSSKKNIGDIYTISGNVEQYRGIWEFSNATGIKTGNVNDNVTYPTPTEFDGTAAANYVSSPYINYVHFSGKVQKVGSENVITLGETKIYVYGTDEGKVYDISGFTVGYNSSNGCIYVISVIKNEVTMTVAPTEKTWASDNTDAETFTVTAEYSTWDITPTSLEWADVVVDKSAGKITVTPKGINTTDTDYEATLTVSNSVDQSLNKEINLKQLKAGSHLTEYEWVLISDLTNLTEGTYVLASIKTENTWKYMPNTTSSGSNPTLGSFTTAPSNNKLADVNVSDDMKWDLTSTGTANEFYIRPSGSTTIGLGTTDTIGANIRISGTYKDTKWTFSKNEKANWQISRPKKDSTDRMHLAVYSDEAWRNYIIATSNQNGKFYIFKKVEKNN